MVGCSRLNRSPFCLSNKHRNQAASGRLSERKVWTQSRPHIGHHVPCRLCPLSTPAPQAPPPPASTPARRSAADPESPPAPACPQAHPPSARPEPLSPPPTRAPAA